MTELYESVGRIVAETGMDWERALDMPVEIRNAVINGIEEKIERKVERDRKRAEAIVKAFGG